MVAMGEKRRYVVFYFGYVPSDDSREPSRYIMFKLAIEPNISAKEPYTSKKSPQHLQKSPTHLQKSPT